MRHFVGPALFALGFLLVLFDAFRLHREVTLEGRITERRIECLLDMTVNRGGTTKSFRKGPMSCDFVSQQKLLNPDATINVVEVCKPVVSFRAPDGVWVEAPASGDSYPSLTCSAHKIGDSIPIGYTADVAPSVRPPAMPYGSVLGPLLMLLGTFCILIGRRHKAETPQEEGEWADRIDVDAKRKLRQRAISKASSSKKRPLPKTAPRPRTQT